MSKHSPGPWTWRPSTCGEPGAQSALCDAEDHWILTTNTDEEISVSPVNARLIAAAPRILELIREFAGRCTFPSMPCASWVAEHPGEKVCRYCRTKSLLAEIDGAKEPG